MPTLVGGGGRMPDLVPVLFCAQGLAEDEFFVLGDGVTITIGRSRTCDVSIQRFSKYLAMSEAAQVACDGASKISRMHMKVTIRGTSVIAENLSPAGSWCNGSHFTKTVEHDFSKSMIVFRLGPAPETFTVAQRTPDEIERLFQKTAPAVPKPTTQRKSSEPETVGTAIKVSPPPPPKTSAKATASTQMPATVTFQRAAGGKKTVPVKTGEELLAFLESVGAPCADRGCGMGSCQTCKLKAVKGRANVTMITEYDDSGLEADEFLPCCSSLTGPIEVVKA